MLLNGRFSWSFTLVLSQRETFKDEDHVRVHPIITKGGNLVNVVPDEVVIETLVRASNKDAIADAAFKTDRAFKAGAAAIWSHLPDHNSPRISSNFKNTGQMKMYLRQLRSQQHQ